MADEFWNERFAWLEPGEIEEYVIEVDSGKPVDRYNKIAKTAMLVGAVATVAIFGAIELLNRGPSREQALSAKLQAKNYDPYAAASFNYLVNLAPKQVDAQTISNRQQLGRDIQNAAVRVSLAAFKEGLDNQGQAVDMYDVAIELMTSNTQAELERDGFILTGEDPVVCDAPAPDGDHGYSPLDYSNHPPQDFYIKTEMVDGRQQTVIPLGTEEMPGAADPLYALMHPDSIAYLPAGVVLPCVDEYPHPVYPPNNSTYPDASDFVVELY